MVGKRYRPKSTTANYPITTIAGEIERVIIPDNVRAWQQHTKVYYSFETVDGEHLFLRDNSQQLMKILREILN